MPHALPPPPDIPEGLEHMLPQFVAEMRKDAATLSALAQAPLDQLADHAHAMRGKAAMFGEAVLYGLLTRIEEKAMAGDGGGVVALINQVIERSGQLALYERTTALDAS